MQSGIVLIGAGGHARVVQDALQTQGKQLLGAVCLADRVSRGSGLNILGGDEVLESTELSECFLALGIGQLSRRKQFFCTWKERGRHFMSVMHSFSYLSPNVVRGEGLQVMAGAVLQTGVKCGNNVLVNTGATVDHDCTLGSHVHIGPGATICGGCSIASDVHIGAGAVVREGLQIAEGAFVAAGAVVVKDVAQAQMVLGVPARERL